jgi:hypothetical protein
MRNIVQREVAGSRQIAYQCNVDLLCGKLICVKSSRCYDIVAMNVVFE